MAKKSKRRRYTVPNMDAAHRLGEIAQDALEAARARTPDQHSHATRLFRAIYGPLGGGALIADKNGIKSTSKGGR